MVKAKIIEVVSEEVEVPALPRHQGIVRWWSPEKNYGFIEVPEENGEKKPDIFVHFTGIAGKGWKNLADGQHVDFEIVQGLKGDQANNVVVITEPQSGEVLAEVLGKVVEVE